MRVGQAVRPSGLLTAQEDYVPRRVSRTDIAEAAAALERLLAAIEAGDVDVTTPRDVALLRRLQGTLAGWQAALGESPGEPHPHS